MTKEIKIKTLDSGAAFNIIPGSTGSVSRDGEQLDDTIFGQDFKSSQPGLINWSISANAFYKGFAGYVATIKKSGTSTSAAGEAMTDIGTPSLRTFQITDVTKDVWDRTVTPVFFDVTGSPGAVIPDSEIKSIDFLYGIVVFNQDQTGPVTCDINFLPLAAYGKANSFSLTQSADTVDTTDLETAQANSGFNTFVATLLTASLELTSFFDISNGFFALLKSRGEVVIEIGPDGSDLSVARGFFKMTSDGLSGDVGGNEEESVTFELAIPGTLTAPAFSWLHDQSTTLSQAILDLLDAWQNKTELICQYLVDGTVGSGGTGVEGNVLVTEISLAGGVNVMNEFSVTLQGSGELNTAIN